MSFLSGFQSIEPRFLSTQEAAIDWLVHAHARADGQDPGPETISRYRRLFQRFGCSPRHIAARGHELEDFTHGDLGRMRIFGSGAPAEGAGASERARFYSEAVERVFDKFYGREREAPEALIHVSCTGYVSPSAAQVLVSKKGWGSLTEVTHAYHMGCYAAVPAIRIGRGFAACGAKRVDIAHTELCTLHLNPALHTPEQLVVQSLFADGFIRYSVTSAPPSGAPALRVLALAERIVPDSSRAMGWVMSEWGMRMTLERDVPWVIAARLPEFVRTLFERAGLPAGSTQPECVFAVHPGGPRIIEGVQDVLGLSDPQVEASKALLRERGNMSSATLPHVWERLLKDRNIPRGRRIVSLAFGPGLTICGALMEKTEKDSS